MNSKLRFGLLLLTQLIIGGLVLLATITVIMFICYKPEPKLIRSYETPMDEISLSLDNDTMIYDVFIQEENRHIYVPYENAHIVICDDTDIVVREYTNAKNNEIYFLINGLFYT